LSYNLLDIECLRAEKPLIGAANERPWEDACMRDFLATTAVLALVVATPALAQTAPTQDAAPAAQPDAAGADGDVIVTARKRAESIRDIPGTISAVTGDQLDAKGPQSSTGDLLNAVPGVRFNDVASENLSEVAVRGSGTQRATGADSGVGLFVNGAYAGSSVLGGRNFKTVDYFDLERIEVLEGPQGALYGRNSEFGVVNIILAKPKFQNSGYVRDIYNFDLEQDRLAGVVNGKLSDTVAVRIGGEGYVQRSGQFYDPNHNKYYDTTRGWDGRAQIRLRTGGLDATLLVDAQDLRLPSFVNSYIAPVGLFPAALPQGLFQSRYVLPHEGIDGMQQKQQRAMLSASYDLGGGVKLESTTMFSRLHSSQQYAAAIDYATEVTLRQQGGLGIYPFAQVMTDVHDKTFYQDLHLSGTGADGRLNWLVGGEALVQRDQYQITNATSPCAFTTVAQGICAGTPTAPLCYKPLATSANCPAVFPLIFGTDSRTQQRFNSFAAYASLQYKIGDVTLSGEGRVSHDYKLATQYGYALYTTNYSKLPSAYSFNSTEPNFSATISYKAPNALNTLIYAKVGTGYRAGGVNNGSYIAAAPNQFVFTYGNEGTIGYEIGLKTNLARNVFLRLSGYLSRTKDAITSINDGCTATNACGTGAQIFNINGGTIHAKGIEAAIDGRFRAAGGALSISLNAGVQGAHFVSVPAGVTGTPIVGSSVAQTPDLTMSATIDYRHKIATNLMGFINVNYTGQRGGVQDTAVSLTAPAIAMDDYDVFGMQAGLIFKKVAVAFFVKNLTDTVIQALKFQQVVGGVGTVYAVRYNKPRTIGASISYRF
jgi:iron complex outermembrane receptor protein